MHLYFLLLLRFLSLRSPLKDARSCESACNQQPPFFQELLTLEGLALGKNVLVDGSLRNAEWNREFFSRIRAEHPSVKVGLQVASKHHHHHHHHHHQMLGVVCSTSIGLTVGFCAQLAIIHVVASPDAVLERSERRALETGRRVPREVGPGPHLGDTLSLSNLGVDEQRGGAG